MNVTESKRDEHSSKCVLTNGVLVTRELVDQLFEGSSDEIGWCGGGGCRL